MADIISTVLDGIQHIKTCWAMPPSLPYAVYHDRTTRRGADLYNGITEHNITIELYAQKPAEDLEALIEQRLDALGLEYVREERMWIDTEHFFETVYDFTYTEKGFA